MDNSLVIDASTIVKGMNAADSYVDSPAVSKHSVRVIARTNNTGSADQPTGDVGGCGGGGCMMVAGED